jgi:hypothetical protein
LAASYRKQCALSFTTENCYSNFYLNQEAIYKVLTQTNYDGRELSDETGHTPRGTSVVGAIVS